MQVLDMLVKNSFATKRRRIRIHVHEKKNTERHNAGKLVQLSQEECIADLYSHSLTDDRFDNFLEILRPNPALGNPISVIYILVRKAY